MRRLRRRGRRMCRIVLSVLVEIIRLCLSVFLLRKTVGGDRGGNVGSGCGNNNCDGDDAEECKVRV